MHLQNSITIYGKLEENWSANETVSIDLMSYLPYLSGYKTFFCISRMTSNIKFSRMKFCYNTSFALPKQPQRSRSILLNGSEIVLDKKKICLMTEEIRYMDFM